MKKKKDQGGLLFCFCSEAVKVLRRNMKNMKGAKKYDASYKQNQGKKFLGWRKEKFELKLGITMNEFLFTGR